MVRVRAAAYGFEYPNRMGTAATSATLYTQLSIAPKPTSVIARRTSSVAARGHDVEAGIDEVAHHTGLVQRDHQIPAVNDRAARAPS